MWTRALTHRTFALSWRQTASRVTIWSIRQGHERKSPYWTQKRKSGERSYSSRTAVKRPEQVSNPRSSVSHAPYIPFLTADLSAAAGSVLRDATHVRGCLVCGPHQHGPLLFAVRHPLHEAARRSVSANGYLSVFSCLSAPRREGEEEMRTAVTPLMVCFAPARRASCLLRNAESSPHICNGLRMCNGPSDMAQKFEGGGEEWKQMTHDDGRKYYFNMKTGMTQFFPDKVRLPPPGDPRPVCVQRF